MQTNANNYENHAKLITQTKFTVFNIILSVKNVNQYYFYLIQKEKKRSKNDHMTYAKHL